MKRYLPLLLAMLAGCGQQDAIESRIKSRLKDPESARFREIIVNRKGDVACAIWTAKNSFGGYGDWSATKLEKVPAGWVITEPEMRPGMCSEERFKASDDMEEASAKLRKAIDNASPETRRILERELSAEEKEERRKQEAADKELQELVKAPEKK